MYGAMLVILWGLLMAFAFGCCLAMAPAPVPAQTADPYEADIAAFRAELHDWDRG